MNILIKNAGIITNDTSRPYIDCGSIGIGSGCIEFVAGQNDAVPEFKADKTIDAKNRIVMPGLVNSHTHCAMTLLRNYSDDCKLEQWLFDEIFPAESKLTSEDVYWGALLGICEMIKSGTTSFADMYLHMEAVAQAAFESGIRVNLCRSPFNLIDVDNKVIADDTASCIEYFKKWDNSAGGKMKVYIEVHSTYLYDWNWLEDAAALAKQLGTGIHIHLLETKTEREESIKRYGMNSAEVCRKCGIFDVPVIAAHCVHLSENDMDILAHYDVNVAHNPGSNNYSLHIRCLCSINYRGERVVNRIQVRLISL